MRQNAAALTFSGSVLHAWSGDQYDQNIAASAINVYQNTIIIARGLIIVSVRILLWFKVCIFHQFCAALVEPFST